MVIKSATTVRNEWSSTCDETVRVRPSFIKRTRDLLVLCGAEDMLALLQDCVYTATVYKEADGTFTVFSNEMDLAENAATEEEATARLCASILEYAEEYYENYEMYSRAPNRRPHIPYILKALLLADPKKIEGELQCQAGEK